MGKEYWFSSKKLSICVAFCDKMKIRFLPSGPQKFYPNKIYYKKYMKNGGKYFVDNFDTIITKWYLHNNNSFKE